jgi:hypothetical protein
MSPVIFCWARVIAAVFASLSVTPSGSRKLEAALSEYWPSAALVGDFNVAVELYVPVVIDQFVGGVQVTASELLGTR